MSGFVSGGMIPDAPAGVSGGMMPDAMMGSSGGGGHRDLTLGEARRKAVAVFEEAGIADAALDAMLLLEWSTGLSRSLILAEPDGELPRGAAAKFAAAVERRRRHEPLQYITGTQEFMGLDFYVDSRVLIPRQDTEILAEEACGFLKPGMDFLDLCTGSGCILISLALICAGSNGTGTDISKDALDVAGRNAASHGADVRLVESDLFEKVEGSFDLIVSNPPYIKSGDIPGLMEEVKGYEPVHALDGHADGLYFYNRIVNEAPAFLKSGGRLMMEIGCSQAGDVTEVMAGAGFEDIKVVRDLCGHDRVVEGVYV